MVAFGRPARHTGAAQVLCALTLMGTASMALTAGRADAQTATDQRIDPALIATVHEFRSCMGSIPPREATILEWRTGLGTKSVLSPAQLASRLGISKARALAGQAHGVAALEVARASGACTANGSAVIRSHPSSQGWSQSSVLIALGIMALGGVALLALLLREMRD